MPGNLFPGLGSALDAGCGDSLHEELLGKHEEDDDREGNFLYIRLSSFNFFLKTGFSLPSILSVFPNQVTYIIENLFTIFHKRC